MSLSDQESSVASQQDSADEDEVGYLFLSNCSVKLVDHKDDDKTAIARGKWMNIEVPSVSLEENGSGSLTGMCPRCDLLLTSSSASLASFTSLRIYSMPYFDGTMSDRMCDKTKCSSHCCNDRNRSDAALMAGMAWSCQSHNDIVIRSIQVLFKEPALEEKEGGDDTSLGMGSLKTTGLEGYEQQRTPCDSLPVALVITFAMPQLTRRHVVEPTTIVSRSARKRSASVVLPACTQLLLSMMRSDWCVLDREMETLQVNFRAEPATVNQLEHDGTLTKAACPAFPPKLSLEELYHRIKSASKATLCQKKSHVYCQLQVIPEDILTDVLAPFLRARSLDALRTSCTYLHRVLRSVVPGMKLRLYEHQVRSLEWMRKREAYELMEADILRSGMSDNVSFNNDVHRTVTGGATTCLRTRRSSQGDVWRVNQHDGRHWNHGNVINSVGSALTRRVARGGLLCDDPGLGKTITVLSLVLQTFGVSTNSRRPAQEPDENPTNKKKRNLHMIFEAYWRDHVPPSYKRQLLNKLLLSVRKADRESYYFDRDVDPELDHCPDYLDIVHRPMSFQRISHLITNEDVYLSDFRRFLSDTDLCFRNAMVYNPPEHVVHQVAKRIQNSFKKAIDLFKEEQVQSAIKSFSSASSKPDSSVAAIIEQGRKNELRESLLQSSGTLLVVPKTLLNHWEEQILMHVDTRYCTNAMPIVYSYSGAISRNQRDRVGEMITDKHCPLVFIDKAGITPLPAAEVLSQFHIVITTNQRFSHEWKKGSFEDELQNCGGPELGDISSEARLSRSQSATACPLLRVEWLRLVVDEGHSMGRGSLNSSILFASWISAQRRWAMTGTPTPQTVARSGLKNILGLLKFLQHDFFSRRLGGNLTWQSRVSRSWDNGELSAFFRLHSLLSLLMVRHTKLDISGLPPPIFAKTYLSLGKEETVAYNSLANVIRSNILLTSMKGSTSGHQDSLLNPTQGKYAKEAFRNVRLACCGGSRVIPKLAERFWIETLEMLTEFGVESFKIQIIRNYLHRAVTEQLSSCMKCGMQLSTLLILPCADLICTECLHNTSRQCPVCDETFIVDQLQRLQPGFVHDWAHNLEEKDQNRRDRKLQWQHRRRSQERSDGSDEDGNIVMAGIDQSGQVPMQPARAQRRSRLWGDGHACEYDPASTDGLCVLCLNSHMTRIGCEFDEETMRCSICYKTAERCPEEETKSFYLTEKLAELRTACLHLSSVDPNHRPLKAIVFSQFRSVLNLVGDRLFRRFGVACVADYFSSSRTEELTRFTKDPRCFCMTLTKDGAEGLDLSFVTHIFFVEEVWDRSLANQAVARAWRLGSKGRVEVETLVARDSAEETLAELATGKQKVLEDVDALQTLKANKQDRSKLVHVLKTIRPIRGRWFGGTSSHIGKRTRKGDQPGRKPKVVRFQM